MAGRLGMGRSVGVWVAPRMSEGNHPCNACRLLAKQVRREHRARSAAHRSAAVGRLAGPCRVGVRACARCVGSDCAARFGLADGASERIAVGWADAVCDCRILENQAVLIEHVCVKTPLEKWGTNPKKPNKHGERKKSHRLVTYYNKSNRLCRPRAPP